MRLCEMLKIEKGVTAVIGSGGKTSLLHALAEELPGTVILCTTTRIFPSDVFRTLISPDETEISAALKTSRVICIGEPAEDGKLRNPNLPMVTLAELADYVLVEADGAKRLPLKAHAPHEPVIPESANQTICVVGASGFGEPIREAAHRFERFAELAGARADQAATPEMAARVIAVEALADRVFINQADNEKSLGAAKALAQGLDIPVVAGSIKKQEYQMIR